MRYLLLADTQTSWQNYRLTEELLAFVNEQRFDALIHLGDVKHHMNPVDNRVTRLWVDWIRYHKREKKRPVYLLAGNHDATSIYDEDFDWLHVVGKATGAIACTQDGYVYDDAEGTALFFLPFHREASKLWPEAVRVFQRHELWGAKRKYLFLHGDVNGAQYQGKEVTEGASWVDMKFEHFDHTYAGHIHKRQTIANSVTYVGSPFAHDWSEANQRKGIYILDTTTNRHKFIESPIPGLYDPDLPGDLIENARSVRVRIPYANQEELVYHTGQARQMWAAKYPNAAIETVPIPVQSASETSTTASTVEEAITAYCENLGVPGLKERLSYLVKSSARPQEDLRFLKIEAKNVLCFESVEVDFTKTGGLKLVVGENKDWPGRSNGAGKSSFLGLVLLAMEGKTLKGQEADAWKRRNSTGPCYIKFWFQVGGKEYRIERFRNPQALRLYCGGTEISTANTQQRITELIGLSWLLATNTLYVDQGRVHQLIAGTDGVRKQLLYDFLNLDMFKVAQVKAKSHRQLAERAFEECQENVRVTEAIYEREKANLTRLEADRPTGSAAIAMELVKKANRHNKEEPEVTPDPGHAFHSGVFEYGRLEKQLNSFSRQLKNCPTCGQPLSLTDNTATVEKIKRQMVALHANIKPLAAQFEAHQESTAAHKEWEEAGQKLRVKLTAAEAALKNEQLWDAKIEQQKTQVQEQKRFLTRTKSLLPVLEQDVKFAKIVIEALGKDGVPAILCQNICPVLSTSAAVYSDMLTDGELKAAFTIENEALKITVDNPHGGSSIKDQSAGELHMLSLITAFALRDLYTRTNFLVVDEPAESLDEVNARKLAKAMHRLAARYETLYVSTHNVFAQQELAGAGVVRIIKENGISCLKTQ